MVKSTSPKVLAHTVLEFALVCAIVSTLAVSVAYVALLTYDPETSYATDAKNYYLPMYFGEDPANYAHSARRVLVPLLARSLPDLPEHLFANSRVVNAQFQAVAKFAVLNLIFLTLTGCVVYYLMRSFEGITRELGLLAGLAWLSAPAVVHWGGIPLIDAGFWFFFGLSALAVRQNKPVLLGIVVLLGALTKELTFLVLVLIILAPYSIRDRLKLSIALVPAAIVYVILITVTASPSVADYAIGSSFQQVLNSLRYTFSLRGFVRAFLAFGPLWLLAIVGIARYRAPSILKRWALFVPLIFLLSSLAGAKVLQRQLVVLFPVVIPLSIFGLRGILDELSAVQLPTR